MEDRALLIITHGKFGQSLLQSVEMIMGPQKDVKALTLMPEDSVDDLRTQAVDEITAFQQQKKDVIVLCDVLGGSPSNVSLFLLKKGVKNIITGINLPMLIEMFSKYKLESNTEKLLSEVSDIARGGIKILNKEFLKEN